MRPNASSLTLILSGLSLTQAATYDRRNEGNGAGGVARPNIASGFMNMFGRLGMQQTVTETVRQTITVGGAGAVGGAANATGAATVTVTAAATTVTVCPGQAQGAIEGVAGGGSATAAPGGAVAAPGQDVPHGGVGVTIVSVPADARKTSLVGNQPAASQTAGAPPASAPPASAPPASAPPAASQPAGAPAAGAPPAASSGNADANTSLAPPPTQTDTNQPGLTQPPGASSSADASGTLKAPPGLSNPSGGAPIVGAPISETSAAASGSSTLAAPPGLASSLTNTLVIPGTGNAAVPTTAPNPSGAFGGEAGFIPLQSAAVSVPPPSVTPGVANGAGVGPTLDVSGLTLSSQLNLGNLVQQTGTPRA